ncbi:MAG: outer membrane beta-barrel protein [Desulfobulbaceae bacterium]|jgi:hypothetical protein|nr:outer membrane beta-barrel protein [Desulfobulbaceae bacterium]
MGRRKIYHIVAAVGALATVLAGADAMAAGRFIITPHVEASIEHNSNFYRSEHNEAEVTTLGISPGIQVIYKTAKTKITADGTLERHEYDSDDDDGVGDIDDYSYTGGKASLDVTSEVTDRLTVGVKDNMRVTRDPEYVDEYSNEVGRSKYTTNAFTPNIYYDFGNKFGVGARYQNSLIDYSGNDGEDYDENRGAVDLFYNFNRSTAVYLEYQIWNGDYDGMSSDYLAHQVSLNASKQFNYFTFTAGAGYYSRDFDDSGYDTLDGVTWKVTVDGQDRREEEDTKPRSFVRLALIHDLNNYGSGDSYYEATRLELKGGYMFGPKLGVSGLAMYQNSDYQINPSDRSDDLYVLSAQIGYEVIDNLTLALEGGYRDRDSDAVNESYDDTFIMAKLDYSYDFGHQ